MASPTDVDTHIDAAIAALQDGDPTTARRRVALAELVVASLPSTTVDGTSVRYDQIERAKQAIANYESADSGGIVSLPVEFHP